MISVFHSGPRRRVWPFVLAAAIVAGVVCVGCVPADSDTGDDASGTGGTTAAAGTNGAAGTTAAAGTNGAAGTIAAAGTNGAAGTIAAAGTNGAAGGSGGSSAGTGGGSAGSLGRGGSSGGAGSGGGGRGGGGRGGAGGGIAGRGGTSGGAGTSGGGGAGGGGDFRPCPTNGDACKVLPFGDSITFGIGFNGGYRVDLFSRAVMASKKLTFVGPEANGPMTVANMMFPTSHAGYSGYTVAQITANNIYNPAIGNTAATMGEVPHIVLLHIGTNDIYGSDPGGAPQRLATLVDKLTTSLPNSLIVVAKIIPLSGNNGVTTFNNAITPLVQQRISAGNHVVLVDQFTGFPTSELGDGVHPNQAGYTRMAGVWYAAIGSLLP